MHDVAPSGDGAATSTEPAVEVPKKKKKKKKKKKRRKKVQEEETVAAVKRPSVPRFPHPLGGETNLGFPSVAATAVPITDRIKELVSMKERYSKSLLLGRFAKKAAGRNETSTEGPANAANVEVADLAVTESPGLVLETSNLSWAKPRRSKSHNRPKQSSDCDAKAKSRQRAKSEAPPIIDPLGGLAIIGQATDCLKKALASSKNWLAEQAADKKKREEDSGDAALSALYSSFSSMKDAKGRKVALQNRNKVIRILHVLSTKVAIPVCRHFGLRYNFFSEHHCQAKKAGVTVKDPLVLRKENPDGTVTEEARSLVTIRLRIRVHPTKGDPHTQFISKGTQLAVLLHELCHLKHMNHGKDFMLFLRDIFAYATKLGAFSPTDMDNEIPSPWPWENEIFRTGGEASDEVLLTLFAEHKAVQREKAKAAEEELARKAVAQAAETDTLDVAPVMVQEDPDGTAVQPPPMRFDASSAGTVDGRLNLTAAFQNGAACIDECCADTGGPTAMEYGGDTTAEFADLIEFETGSHTASPMLSTPPRARASRSRSLSRGRGLLDSEQSLGRSSSVAKLPQIPGTASPCPPPPLPHLGSPSRGRSTLPMVPTLPRI